MGARATSGAVLLALWCGCAPFDKAALYSCATDGDCADGDHCVDTVCRPPGYVAPEGANDEPAAGALFAGCHIGLNVPATAAGNVLFGVVDFGAVEAGDSAWQLDVELFNDGTADCALEMTALHQAEGRAWSAGFPSDDGTATIDVAATATLTVSYDALMRENNANAAPCRAGDASQCGDYVDLSVRGGDYTSIRLLLAADTTWRMCVSDAACDGGWRCDDDHCHPPGDTAPPAPAAPGEGACDLYFDCLADCADEVCRAECRTRHFDNCLACRAAFDACAETACVCETRYVFDRVCVLEHGCDARYAPCGSNLEDVTVDVCP